jgi:hypothetical protein
MKQWETTRNNQKHQETTRNKLTIKISYELKH